MIGSLSPISQAKSISEYNVKDVVLISETNKTRYARSQ